jgi:hypothetical protein
MKDAIVEGTAGTVSRHIVGEKMGAPDAHPAVVSDCAS